MSWSSLFAPYVKNVYVVKANSLFPSIWRPTTGCYHSHSIRNHNKSVIFFYQGKPSVVSVKLLYSKINHQFGIAYRFLFSMRLVTFLSQSLNRISNDSHSNLYQPNRNWPSKPRDAEDKFALDAVTVQVHNCFKVNHAADLATRKLTDVCKSTIYFVVYIFAELTWALIHLL